jgi:hypothetical protein
MQNENIETNDSDTPKETCGDSGIASSEKKHTQVPSSIVKIQELVDSFCKQEITKDKEERSAQIQHGLGIANDLFKELGKFEKNFNHIFAYVCIGMGLVFLKLKKLNKGSGVNWEEWASVNSPQISQRSRIDYMALAERTDCHQYAILGTDRLLMLIRATKNHTSDNRIGDFLKKYSIVCDDSSRDTIKDFKHEVDTAINLNKLENLGITADPKLVKALTRFLPKFKTPVMDKLKTINDSKGDVNLYLSTLVENKGKEPVVHSKSKALRDFNTMGQKLVQVADYLLQNDDAIENLDANIVLELLEKLNAVKEAANIE